MSLPKLQRQGDVPLYRQIGRLRVREIDYLSAKPDNDKLRARVS